MEPRGIQVNGEFWTSAEMVGSTDAELAALAAGAIADKERELRLLGAIERARDALAAAEGGGRC